MKKINFDARKTLWKRIFKKNEYFLLYVIKSFFHCKMSKFAEYEAAYTEGNVSLNFCFFPILILWQSKEFSTKSITDNI